MNKELKPCPFCGGKASASIDTEATRDSQGRLWAFTVVCDSCCASSGLTFSSKRAIKAWNRRAANEVIGSIFDDLELLEVK